MKTIGAVDAGKNLMQLIGEAANSHEPIQILGETANGVLVSEDDWRSIQETLYLVSLPGMRESIREGLDTPVEQCDEELRW